LDSPPRLDVTTASIAELVAERAAAAPDAVAVEDGDRSLTYRELEQASAGVAAALRERGVEDEEVIGVCLPRSWRAVCAFLGVIRAGAAYVPISPDYPARRKQQLLELADARCVLTDAGAVAGLPSDCESLDLETLARREAEAPATSGGDRLAYVLFTSGSTGTPKGVEITHANLMHLFTSGSDLLPVSGDTVLGVAPIEFDIAALETWGALVAGARLVLVPPGRPDPRAVGRLIAERDVTFAFFAAGLFEQVVRAAVRDLGGMRLIAAGGDVMSPAAARAVLQAHPGVRVLNGYGPTETSIIASSFEVEDVDGAPLPIGRALPGYELHVLDEEGEPVAAGEPGELWIGGPGVARGYRNDPRRTADRFRPDPFADRGEARMYGSGDLVRLRPDGELEFLGRRDHQVKIAGHRVEPGEVEQVLGAHPEVNQAAVVAREDVAGHKRLVAYVSLRDGAGADPEVLPHHLAERLPAYMLPASIEVLPELPLTERGKIDRRALPAPRQGSGGAATATGRAGEVADLMSELLGVEAIGGEDDFFGLGGDSLLAIQLVGRLRDRFDADLDVGTVFEARTASQLAGRLGEGATPERPPLRRAEGHTGPAPVTFAQRRAWWFERMNPGSISFQFAALLHLEGDLDEEALRGALGDLMRRHEVLRTSIEERDGEPVQIVHDEVPVPLEVVDLPGESGLGWARFVRSRVRVRIGLNRAPLVRWTLVKRGPGKWSLIDVEHHAVHDGWSFMLVLAELAELYSSRVEGRGPQLPQLPVQLTDFARWERQLLGSELERRQLDFWRRTLDPDPRLLELPAVRPRPPRESFAGSSIRRRVPIDLAEAIKQLAREEQVTAFMITLAAFATLLGRVGEADDLQIASGLANRRDPAADRLVGMTVGTVALRIDLSDDPTVRILLKRVRSMVLDAIGNADVPFERVVEALAPKRQAHRSPLVQTLFSFDDAPATGGKWSGLDVEVVQTVPNGSAKADLNVIGVDHGDGNPFFIWEHSDLFSDAVADQLAGHHLELLAQFVADPGARVSELRLLDEEEEGELLRRGRGDGDFDREATVPDLVERQAQRRPHAEAIHDERESLSYGELARRAAAVAGALRERGVGVGDAVAVLLPRSVRSVVAQLGILKAGAAYVPLDPSHPAGRIRRSLEDAGATAALADPELASMLPPGLETLSVDEALEAEPVEGTGSGPEDLAYVMYTSGSTGEPKGVEVTHRNVARLVDAPGFADLGPGTVMLHAASPAFDAATLEIWGPLANGGTVSVLGRHPSPDEVAAAIAARGVTTMWLTAGLFHELVDRRPECLSSVRHLLAGGDVLSPDHVERALAALPPDGRLSNGYGPTETTTFALVQEIRPGDRVDGPIPIGRPIQATTCDVIDAAGRPAPVGVAGELWIGGDGVSRGYRGDPELTAARFVADPRRPGGRCYRSGDRVRRLGDGTIEFLGRGDRQLKVRGVRVEPAEIEQVLRAHPEVADVAVVPYEREPGEEALAAYVVATDESAAPTPAALRVHAVAELPAAMVPAAWVSLDALPLTANGKVDRRRLPAPSREHLAAGSAGSSRPEGEAEEEVVGIFERVLGVEEVGVEDDFFALGGHSLLAVSLFTELERIAGRRLPLATVFDASTPRALAALLDSGAPAPRWSNLVPLKPSGSRPPLFAVTAGDGNVVGFGPLARSMSAEQPLYALQPSGLDGYSTIDRGIEAMAARCVEEIRTVQPRGPYLLAGRCNGITVAYEIAQQLRTMGEEVPLLASLDSGPPLAGPPQLEPGVDMDKFMEGACLRAREAGEEAPALEEPALAAWLRAEVGPRISRYGHELWFWREDVQERWPDPLGKDSSPYADWLWRHARVENSLAPQLMVPLPHEHCLLPNGQQWDWVLDEAWQGLGRKPEDPLSEDGWATLREELLEPLAGGLSNRYLLGAAARPDLAAAFPQPLGRDAGALLSWAWSEGIAQGLSPRLLPRPPFGIPRRLRLSLARDDAVRAAWRGASLAAGEGLAQRRDQTLAWVERGLKRPLPRSRKRLEDRIIRAAREARERYRAKPWPGRIVVVKSSEAFENPAHIAWPARARGGLEVHRLPVDHLGMLRDPEAAALLADCLEECVSRALDGAAALESPPSAASSGAS
jgi:amino acid adenylation domain-containing protein